MGSWILASNIAPSPTFSCLQREYQHGCVVPLQRNPRQASRLKFKDINGIPFVPICNIYPLAASTKKRSSLITVAAISGGPATSSATLKDVPGDDDPSFLVSLRDRSDYWSKGVDAFFTDLMKKYGSTVIQVYMPPGPPLFPDSKTIMLLDEKSYPVLYDMTKVEKKDVFTGTYTPSTDYTGGFRVLSYVDPGEKNHAPLKDFAFEILKSNGKKWFPEFHKAFSEACAKWELLLAKDGKADCASGVQQFSLNFLLRSVLGRDPAAPGDASLGTNGPTYIQLWILPQLLPQTSLGLPKPIEFLYHNIPVPYFLVSYFYNKLYNFFKIYGKEALDMAATKFGLGREEACHNLLFYVCFNTWGGFQVLFPSILSRIAEAGPGLQKELAAEVRKAVDTNGGLTMSAIESMELVHSTVYEVMRVDPPVPFQYGRAKTDLIIESHDAAYKVKKGALIGGYLGIAMKDPKVFDAPNEFRPKRFMGEEGSKLVQYMLWSNGPETEDPTVNNKQCAGKNFVVLMARLLVAEFFLRYDTFKIGPITAKGANKIFDFTALEKRAAL